MVSLHPVDRPCRSRPVGRLSCAGIATLAVALLGVGGCGRAAPVSGPGASKPPDPAAGLEVTETNKDLGLLQWGAKARAEFRFRNTTAAPLSLSLGAASCSCLKVEIEPKGVLPPGEQGRLVLHLNTTDRLGAGKIQGCVRLGTNRKVEAIEFCVTGYTEGISSESYVVRPQQVEAGKIPNLKFGIVSGKEDAAVEVTGIDCYRSRPEVEDTKAPPAPLQVKAGRYPLPGVEPVLSKMSIGAPFYLPRDNCYMREVVVPVQLGANFARTVSGTFVVHYRLRGEEKEASIPLLVLASQ